jgi:hypothetical protein
MWLGSVLDTLATNADNIERSDGDVKLNNELAEAGPPHSVPTYLSMD